MFPIRSAAAAPSPYQLNSKKEQGGAESIIMRRRSRLSEPKKKHRFFTNLPSEIIVDILSRLPVRNIICCKCVCKSWLNLLETDEFVKSHLSKSVPGLVLKGKESCKIFEFEDGLDLGHLEHHCIPVTEYNCTYDGLIHGSVNGLLFCYHIIHYCKDGGLYMLNPVTHEYIQIPSLREFARGNLESHTYGFGVGRITGLHKLVRIFHYPTGDKRTPAMVFPGSECQVYTLGTGLWRSIKPGPMFEYIPLSFGAFLKGNLHWLVFDLNSCPLISCFDLEGELFSIFPSPPALMFIRRKYLGLFTLEDGLCLSDCTSRDEIVIWLMKEGLRS